MTGTISYQVYQIWLKVDGIGISKVESRLNSGLKGQNGHKVSDKVHSYNSKDEFVIRANELGNFAKDKFGCKDMQAINNHIIYAYIQSKIEDGLPYKSLSTYISQLEKIQIGLSKIEMKRPEHKELFDRNGLINARKMAKDEALRSEHENRAFERPDSLRSEINDNFKICFDLQRIYGLRVNEATYIKTSQIESEILTIQGKGGYQRQIVLTKEILNRLKSQLNNNNGKIEIPYADYSKNLKRAAKKSKQKYEGTHGLRYNFAQEQYQIKRAQGLSHKEALAIVSYNLGHHRTEITEHYLK